jgi:aspartate kinase
MFEALFDEGVNIEMISTSPIRVSCVIRQEDAERAVRAVHARFDIERDVRERAEHLGAEG